MKYLNAFLFNLLFMIFILILSNYTAKNIKSLNINKNITNIEKLKSKNLTKNSTSFNNSENSFLKKIHNNFRKIKNNSNSFSISNEKLFEDFDLVQEIKNMFSREYLDLFIEYKNDNKRNENKINQYNFFKVDFCNQFSCPGNIGFCSNSTTCKCKDNFVNDRIYNSENNKTYTSLNDYLCSYKLHFQYKAMMLELVLPIGMGHFYCGRYLFGLLKFHLFALLPAFMIYLFGINLKDFFVSKQLFPKLKNVKLENKMNLKDYFKIALFGFNFLIFVIWYTIDGVLFGLNFYKDGNGFGLR